MKRFHVHLRVKDLQENIKFYNVLFATEANVIKPDYAKWMLDDPKVNFAISSSDASHTGIEHLGIQTESSEELHQVYQNMEQAEGKILAEGETTCCYAKSEKSWIADPQGIEWEAFYTHGESTVYGEGRTTKAAPDIMSKWSENKKSNKSKMLELPTFKGGCC